MIVLYDLSLLPSCGRSNSVPIAVQLLHGTRRSRIITCPNVLISLSFSNMIIGNMPACVGEIMSSSCFTAKLGLILGVTTCDVFLCYPCIVVLLFIALLSLVSLLYISGDLHRFLHQG